MQRLWPDQSEIAVISYVIADNEAFMEPHSTMLTGKNLKYVILLMYHVYLKNLMILMYHLLLLKYLLFLKNLKNLKLLFLHSFLVNLMYLLNHLNLKNLLYPKYRYQKIDHKYLLYL